MYDSRQFTMPEFATFCGVTPMTIYCNIRPHQQHQQQHQHQHQHQHHQHRRRQTQHQDQIFVVLGPNLLATRCDESGLFA